MQKRTVRVTVVTLLFATPLAAATLWHIDHTMRQLSIAQDALEVRVNRMIDGVVGIGTALQSYIAPGQLDEPSFERMSELAAELKEDVAALSPMLRSPDGMNDLLLFAESLDTLVVADDRARQNLKRGQDLMAADVIVSDGRNVLDAMMTRLREVQVNERAANSAEAASVALRHWVAFGLLMLPWIPLAVGRVSAAGSNDVAQQPVVEPPAQVENTVPQPESVDLMAAATLCTDLSRAADTTALAQLLHRTASLLDAQGLILWMSAGEQLFAVLGSGYPPATLSRFGPIPRDADNAAAAAWRTGRLTVVESHGKAGAALVAPLFGAEGCAGVLALEIRPGREQDQAVQAVTTMVAAQLGTVVAAWPSASRSQSSAARTA